MTTQRSLKLLILSVLLFAGAGQAAESLSVRLQKAIFAEETEGNLDAAIKIYAEIVEETDTNKPIAAQAQYRLGLCRLKQGKNDEAAAAFRKVIDQFPDAAELAGKSRERLAELGQTFSATVVRQVWSNMGNAQASGRPSPDGRYIAFVDWDTGDLAVRDLVAGVSRRLTNKGPWSDSEAFALEPAISPDGKQIAYGWYNGTNEWIELRVMDLSGSKPYALVTGQTNRSFLPGDWSPDGKSIAAVVAHGQPPNGTLAIATFSVVDGSEQKLVSAEAGDVTTLRFSPDGRFLAFNGARNFSRGRKGLTNDVFLVDVETGEKRKLIPYNARENFLGWDPQGSSVLFSSERRGSVDLWSLKLMNGEPAGPPKVVKGDLGTITPLGLTTGGAFFYITEVSAGTDSYYASADFETGKMLSKSEPLKSLYQPLGMASPKLVASVGLRHLFYCTGNREPSAFIFDIQRREQREIPNSAKWAQRLGWWLPARDAQSVFVCLLYGEGAGFHLLDVATGELAPLALYSDGAWRDTNSARWVFEKDFVAYARLYSDPKKVVLVKHDLRSGRATEYEIPGLPEAAPEGPKTWGQRGILLSNGRSFLFSRKQRAGELNALVCHDLVTGVQTELLTDTSPVSAQHEENGLVVCFVTDPEGGQTLTFFAVGESKLDKKFEVTVPDGFEWRGTYWGGPSLLLIKKGPTPDGALTEIWTLGVETGELKQTEISLPNDGFWMISKGQKGVLIESTSPGHTEVWVMENFLPLDAAR